MHHIIFKSKDNNAKLDYLTNPLAKKYKFALNCLFYPPVQFGPRCTKHPV